MFSLEPRIFVRYEYWYRFLWVKERAFTEHLFNLKLAFILCVNDIDINTVPLRTHVFCIKSLLFVYKFIHILDISRHM